MTWDDEAEVAQEWTQKSDGLRGGYWEDDGEWVDTGFWDDSEDWVSG